ncbi:MAG: hypothetical protein AB1449_03390 [Chloroflexota bacterium]
MFDNLREASERSDLFEESSMAEAKAAQHRPKARRFGLTAGQRFILSLLLLMAVAVVGVMCLVVFQKIYL